MGYRRPSLTHHPPQYVPACHQAGAEGSREVHPLGLATEPAKARPQGRCTHHAASRVPDLSEGDQGPLSASIFTKQGHPAHTLRPQQREEAIQDILSSLRSHLQGGTTMLEEDQWGGCCNYPSAHLPLESHSRSQRREDPHDEALKEAREAHQWVFGSCCMLELNIGRLSQE